jgi:hypothetical protein
MKEMSVKRYMNLMSFTVFAQCLLLVAGNTVYAVPYLQLDANPAGYVDGDEESIVTTDLKFTLYALIDSTSEFFDDDTFYICAAIVPDPGYSVPGPDLGSYTFGDDTSIPIVGNMTYGNPPLEVYLDSKDLPSHGIYETYYHEYLFTLAETSEAVLYNSQNTPGGPTNLTPGPSDDIVLYKAFDVDVSGLDHGYAMHFDLYTYKWDEKKGTYVIDDFAPFSHDVLSAPIPGAVILGILGLGLAGIKLRKFA